jgi:hypothetical protein
MRLRDLRGGEQDFLSRILDHETPSLQVYHPAKRADRC